MGLYWWRGKVKFFVGGLEESGKKQRRDEGCCKMRWGSLGLAVLELVVLGWDDAEEEGTPCGGMLDMEVEILYKF